MNENTKGPGLISVCIGVLSIVGVVLAGVALTHPLAVQTPAPVKVGALAGPDLASLYFSFGGVREWAGSAGFYTASTSLCAIQSPAATTTLVAATVRIDTSTTTASIVEIGKALTAFATTTRLALLTVGANAVNLNLVATTTVTTLTDGVVPPNSWINTMVGFTTGTASAATALTGKCSAVFREI